MAETPAFDIGVSVHTQRWRAWNYEALAAYSFLRFCEDAGIPFTIPGRTIAADSAAGTLARIAPESSHWALATLLRIGNTKAVDEIFDRWSLARMSTPAVDRLISRYLEALRLAVPDITTGDRWHNANFGTRLAGVLPEILSRLCCKCSRDAREKLLDWLLEVYRSDHRSNYREIGHLISRLLEAFPVRERAAIVPRLLDFPILTVFNQVEEMEYPNPFDFLDLRGEPIANQLPISDTVLSVFLAETESDNPITRRRAVATLGKLHNAGLLDEMASQRFAEGLWSRVDDHGLPSGTNYYYRFAFLSLPHPANIDPVERFVRYVRGARFPVQDSEKSTRYDLGGTREVVLCRDIRAASDVRWSTDDVLSIVHRLVQWWDTDKAHWREVRDKGSFPYNVLGKQLSDLVRTLATTVVRYPDSVADEPVRSAVTRVAAECAAHEVPALRLEVACAYAFAVPCDEVLRRVEEAMTAPRTDAVIDALEAMGIVSRHRASESDNGHLMQLLRPASQMIRWRRETALWATFDAVGDVVDEHPWTFVGDVESGVLTGLGRLVVETAVGRKDGAGADASGGFQDMSRRLVVRRTAARLASGCSRTIARTARRFPRSLGRGSPSAGPRRNSWTSRTNGLYRSAITSWLGMDYDQGEAIGPRTWQYGRPAWADQMGYARCGAWRRPAKDASDIYVGEARHSFRADPDELLDSWELEVEGWRVKSRLIDVLADFRKARLDGILPDLFRDRPKALSPTSALDDSRRRESDLEVRIVFGYRVRD